MTIDTQIKINNNPIQKQFLRENSYWYKYLNRNSKYYSSFLNDMKIKYKMTTTDKINKAIDSINMLSEIIGSVENQTVAVLANYDICDANYAFLTYVYVH